MWEKRRLSQLSFSPCLQTKIKVTQVVVVAAAVLPVAASSMVKDNCAVNGYSLIQCFSTFFMRENLYFQSLAAHLKLFQ